MCSLWTTWPCWSSLSERRYPSQPSPPFPSFCFTSSYGHRHYSQVFTAYAFQSELLLRLHARYPLPLEADLDYEFLGLRLRPQTGGRLHVHPRLPATCTYPDLYCNPGYMLFRSYVPMSIKRSFVVGVAIRIDQFTLPNTMKPSIWKSFAETLSKECGFPFSLLSKWSREWQHGALSWIPVD